MILEEIRKKVFEAKPIFGSIYEKFGEISWAKYLEENLPLRKPLTKENHELIEQVEKLVTALLGKDKALLVRQTLEESFFASTAEHHGILCHPFFLNSVLARSTKNNGKPMGVIVLAFGGISISNSSFPRGIFFHNERLEEVRLPFISLKHRSRPLYGLEAVSKENLKKKFNRVISKSGAGIERKLELLKSEFIDNHDFKKISEVKTASEQFTIINNAIWKNIFGNTRSELFFLEIETLAVELLKARHLKRGTLIEKIIFDQNLREKFIKNFENIIGAHNTSEKRGSHFFWYIDGEKKEREQLFLVGENLETPSGLKISLDGELAKEKILELLEQKKLMPTMALTFSIISFYHGLTCGGGFSQVGYLGEMKEAYQKTVRDQLSGDNKMLANLRTDIFTGEFILATIGKKASLVEKGKSVAATLSDLYLFGKDDLSKKIDALVSKVSIKDSLDQMMPEFYKIITGGKVNAENLPVIPPLITLKKEEKRCPYCGNNQVHHLSYYLIKSLEVPLKPLSNVVFLSEQPFFKAIIKMVTTPLIWLFQGLGVLTFNHDKSKTLSKRSEVIWQEAERRGIVMEQVVILGKPIEQYRAKIKNRWEYFESLPVPHLYGARSYEWMDDKVVLKTKFMAKNIPVARGASVSDYGAAMQIFRQIEKPVIAKPRIGSRGRHTTTFIQTENDLIKAYQIAKQLCHFVVLEEHLIGSVYRATYVGGEVVGILRGDPPRITGTGQNTIRELIEIKNQNKPESVKDVVISPMLIEFLGRQGYSLSSILPEGKTIDLSEKIGISYGGHSAEELPKTHPKLLAHLKRAGDLLAAPVVGFDFIIGDATVDPDTQRWGIIEANSLPFINLHHFPLEGAPINVAAKVWDLWEK